MLGKVPALEIMLDCCEILRESIGWCQETFDQALELPKVMTACQTETDLSGQETRGSCEKRDGPFTLSYGITSLEKVKVRVKGR